MLGINKCQWFVMTHVIRPIVKWLMSVHRDDDLTKLIIQGGSHFWDYLLIQPI